jgi:hypothetical protein
MRIEVEASVAPDRTGYTARAPRVGLAGHGDTEASALAGLRRSAQAWASGLSAAQSLEDALRRRGIPWTPQGELVTVELVRSPFVEAAP